MGDKAGRLGRDGVLWGELKAGAGEVALLAQERGILVGVAHHRRQVSPRVDHANLYTGSRQKDQEKKKL